MIIQKNTVWVLIPVFVFLFIQCPVPERIIEQVEESSTPDTFDDVNNDKKYLKGDYMCSDINNMVILPPNDNVSIETKIDFVIP